MTGSEPTTTAGGCHWPAAPICAINGQIFSRSTNLPIKKRGPLPTAPALKNQKMDFSSTLAAASGCWQPASQHHSQELPPDAIRLSGPTWCSSGITIGTTASAYVGDGWQKGQIVATGVSWAAIATTRFGTHTVRDRRNLLLAAEATAYQKALAKWRRDHHQPEMEVDA